MESARFVAAISRMLLYEGRPVLIARPTGRYPLIHWITASRTRVRKRG